MIFVILFELVVAEKKKKIEIVAWELCFLLVVCKQKLRLIIAQPIPSCSIAVILTSFLDIPIFQ